MSFRQTNRRQGRFFLFFSITFPNPQAKDKKWTVKCSLINYGQNFHDLWHKRTWSVQRFDLHLFYMKNWIVCRCIPDNKWSHLHQNPEIDWKSKYKSGRSRLNHNETVYETLVPTKVNRCFVLQEGCTCSYSYCIIIKITLNAFDSSAFLMQVKRGSISQNETMYTDIFIKEKPPAIYLSDRKIFHSKK